jgi:hypothetical protein
MLKLIPVICMLAAAFVCSCDETKPAAENVSSPQNVDFRPETLLTAGGKAVMLRGQLLYMPVYSNLPYNKGNTRFDMKGYVAIHNTDLGERIRITRVIFFDNDGKPVFDFLKGAPCELPPLAAKDFHIPYEDKSGLGANFLVEWVSDRPVTEPLVECVTVSLIPNQSLALLSRGKVIREIR